MSSEMMRYATGDQPAARALGAGRTCWLARPAAAPTLAARPKANALSSQAIWVHVTDFGPRPPLRPAP